MATPSSAPGEALLAEVREAIRDARGIVILTGAGASADSGIPTFRSRGGLWGRYKPEDLATPQAFARDPCTVWGWYEERRQAVLEATPNAGHRAIASLHLSRDDVTVITQNVDGLHQRALREASTHSPARSDRDEESVLELHGNLLRSRCSGCARVEVECEPVDAREVETLPCCLVCGELMRPDVVWFGEPLDSGVLVRAYEAASEADLCVVAGTSAVVQPAASIPMATCEAGGAIVEVNTESTPLSTMSKWALRGSSATILSAIFDVVSTTPRAREK